MSSRTWLAIVLATLFQGTSLASPQDWIGQWRAFRSAYPYHIQTVALSQPDAVGKRILIVSEPPPDVTMDQLMAVEPKLLSDGVIQRSIIGVDGSVADALFELPAVPEGEIRSLVESLHVKLFGTAYKAYAAEIPTAPPAKADYRFDLHVTAGTLAHWLVPPRPLRASLSWGWLIFFVLFIPYGWRFWRSDRPVRRVLALLIGVVGIGYQMAPWVHQVLSSKPDLSLRF